MIDERERARETSALRAEIHPIVTTRLVPSYGLRAEAAQAVTTALCEFRIRLREAIAALPTGALPDVTDPAPASWRAARDEAEAWGAARLDGLVARDLAPSLLRAVLPPEVARVW